MSGIQELLLILCLALIPFKLGVDPNSLLSGLHIRVLVAAACLTIVIRRARTAKDVVPIEWLKLPVVSFYLIYLSAGLIALAWSSDPIIALSEFARHVSWAIMPIYAFCLGPVSVRGLRLALLSFCATSSCMSTYYLLKLHSASEFAAASNARVINLNQLVYSVHSKNEVGAYAACACAISFAYLMRGEYKKLTLPLVFCFLSSFTFMAVSESKASLGTTIIYACVLLFMESRTKKFVIPAIVTGSLVVLTIIAGVFGTGLGNSMKHVLYKNYYESHTHSLRARKVIWQTTFEYLSNNPIGAAGWAQLSQKYGGLGREGKQYYMNYDANFFLKAWLEVGPIGALALLVVFVSGFAILLKNHMVLPRGSHLSNLNLCLFGIQAVYITMAIQDTWSPHHDRLPYFAAVGMGCFIHLLIQYEQSLARAAQIKNLSRAASRPSGPVQSPANAI